LSYAIETFAAVAADAERRLMPAAEPLTLKMSLLRCYRYDDTVIAADALVPLMILLLIQERTLIAACRILIYICQRR